MSKWACLKNGQHLTQKIFMLYPFKNKCFWFSLYPEFLEEKKQRNIKKLVSSHCFCFGFHANLISDGKERKDLNFSL